MAPAVQHFKGLQQREDRALYWPRHTGDVQTGLASVLSTLTRAALEEGSHDAWLLPAFLQTMCLPVAILQSAHASCK